MLDKSLGTAGHQERLSYSFTEFLGASPPSPEAVSGAKAEGAVSTL